MMTSNSNRIISTHRAIFSLALDEIFEKLNIKNKEKRKSLFKIFIEAYIKYLKSVENILNNKKEDDN